MAEKRQVVEMPVSSGVEITSSTKRVNRRFRIDKAKGQVDAWDMLRAKVDTGSRYRDFNGRTFTTTLPLVATSIRIDPSGPEDFDNGSTYIAVVEYNTVAFSRQQDVELEPDGPPLITPKFGVSQEKVDTDAEGNPIENAAGAAFQNPPTARLADHGFTLEWIRDNTKIINAAKLVRPFNGRVNSKSFLGAKPHEIFCAGVNPRALDNDAAFGSGGLVRYEATFKFKGSFTVQGKVDAVSGPAGDEVPGFDVARRNLSRVLKNPDFDASQAGSQPFKPIMVGDEDSEDRHPVEDPVAISKDGKSLIAADEDPIVFVWAVNKEIDFYNLPFGERGDI